MYRVYIVRLIMAKKLTLEQRIKEGIVEEIDFISCKEFFDNIDDPRVDRTKDHLLIDILLLSLSAIICGAQSITEIESFGKMKEDLLRKFLTLPNGIPSHDTIGRVLASICPTQFAESFFAWTKSLVPNIQGLVSIDGKTVRGSVDGDRSPIHIVSAWSEENNIVLGQIKTEEKSNEIKAIPELLDALDIQEGAVISFDAMGCQRKIADKISASGANYLMALKKNQERLYNCVDRMFNENSSIFKIEDCQTINKGHGGIETRHCSIITDTDWLKKECEWPALRSCIKVERTREIKDKIQHEISYYISDLEATPERFNELVRGHWGVENKLHWVLDMGFNEDHSRVRAKAAAENFALLRKIALNLIKSLKNKKSVKDNMLSAGWNDQHFLKIISQLGVRKNQQV